MTRNMSKEMLPTFMRPLAGLMKVMMRNASPARATRSSLRLALAPDLEGVTGRYLHPSAKEAKWPEKITVESVRAEVWGMTERALGPLVERSPDEPAPTRS
jgi:hypothetical protein